MFSLQHQQIFAEYTGRIGDPFLQVEKFEQSLFSKGILRKLCKLIFSLVQFLYMWAPFYSSFRGLPKQEAAQNAQIRTSLEF